MESEHKYLHKKFKRIASSALDGAGEDCVEPSEQRPPEGNPSEAPIGGSQTINRLQNGFHHQSSSGSSCTSRVNQNCDSEDVTSANFDQERIIDSRNARSVVGNESDVVATDPISRHIPTDQSIVASESLLADGDNNVVGGAPPNNNNIGRNVCHYCNLNCTKPSVLEKHIRSHTNERPYPCVPCGFAFKTKSNLYKHCRSRAHQLRAQGAEVPLGSGGADDEISTGSDQELSSCASGSDEVIET